MFKSIKNKNIAKNNTLISYSFLMDSYYFDIKISNDKAIDELLIISYILFLSRYFFICDDRQRHLMKKLLEKELVKKSYNFDDLMNKVGALVYGTLDDSERGILTDLATQKIALPCEVGLSKGSLGRYDFNVVKSASGLGSIFDMSLGMDIVLLPRLTVIFYGYVRNNLENDEHQEMFFKAIKLFFDSVKNPDEYLEQEVFVDLPQKIATKIFI